MNLKDHFPRASKAFMDANYIISQRTEKNALQPIVDAPKVKSEARRGRMNKTEAEFAMILEAMKRKGEILRWEYEGMTLRWFDMRYTPDFVVLRGSDLRSNGWTRSGIKFIEVKGAHIHYAQQAIARFKGARGFWPEFTFELHQKSKDGWKQLI